jgi:hypothetical protein
MNTTSQATAVEESGLLTDDVLEKEVTDLITSIYTGTLGLTDHELTTFNFIFSTGIENLMN